MRFLCGNCGSVLEQDSCEAEANVTCRKCGASVKVPTDKTSPGAILGDYAIIRTIGYGGMGTVCQAHQLSLDRDVAIKILKPELASDEAFIQNFIHEARIAALMRHPNIIEAYAVCKEDGLFYFAMEYIDGPSLKEIVAKNGPISFEQTIDIASQMTDALAYAWNEKQLVHRDIKPDNILLNSRGQSKLADLGLAQKVSDLSKDGANPDDFYGTPQCLAPELYLGKPATASSDIYGLGATLYYLLAGQFPYAGETPQEQVSRHLTERLRPLSSLRKGVPRPLAALVESMMAKRPCHRYDNYSELASDIERVKSGAMPLHEPKTAYQSPIDENSPSALDDEPTQETSANHPTRLKGILIALAATVLVIISCFSFLHRQPSKESPQALQKRLDKMTDDSERLEELAHLLQDENLTESERETLNDIASPYVESKLEQLRKKYVDEFEQDWNAKSSKDIAAAEAKKRQEAELAEKLRAETVARRIQEENKRREKEERARIEEEARIAKENFEKKRDAFRKSLPKWICAGDFSTPLGELGGMEHSKQEYESTWANEWISRIEKAENFYKLFRNSGDKFAGASLRVLASPTPMRIAEISFDSIKLSGEDKKNTVLSLLTLLPQQWNDLVFDAVKKGHMKEKDAIEALALYLLCKGACPDFVRQTLGKSNDKFAMDEVDDISGAEYIKVMCESMKNMNRAQAKDLHRLLKDSNKKETLEQEEHIRQIINNLK